jgi:hypothetical protein
MTVGMAIGRAAGHAKAALTDYTLGLTIVATTRTALGTGLGIVAGAGVGAAFSHVAGGAELGGIIGGGTALVSALYGSIASE